MLCRRWRKETETAWAINKSLGGGGFNVQPSRPWAERKTPSVSFAPHPSRLSHSSNDPIQGRGQPSGVLL